jgi:hypothetical protein
MTWLVNRLRIPASESQLSLALALCSIAMSLMLWALLWQSDVIAQQGELIRWLRTIKFGG